MFDPVLRIPLINRNPIEYNDSHPIYKTESVHMLQLPKYFRTLV